jgi:tetratricopeptide (TPR) repeat protein
MALLPGLATILAVFPIALGIGFGMNTAPPPGRLDVEEQPPPVRPNRIHTYSTGTDRSRGDELVREGRYEAALHHYRSLGSADPLRVPPGLALRIAICHEGLGLWDEALAGYRAVAGSHDPTAVSAAILGQSRVWVRLKDFAAAEPLLRSLMIPSGDRSPMPRDTVAEVTMLHAIVVAEQLLTHSNHPPAAGLHPVGNLIEWSLGDAVDWSEAKPADSPADSPATDPAAVLPQTTLPTEPQREGTVTLPPHEGAVERPQRDAAATVLSAALALFPNHRLAGPARFARAELAAADGRFREAAEQYSSLTRRSTSPLAVHAAFNAALAYHHLGDLTAACRSLEVVVHGAPGHELHTQSLILLGRTLMDRGEYREASHHLKRAAESRHQPEDQARATVFLAMAQLLDGHPHEAAESLFAHRLQFQDPAIRNAAALMTSIACWRTATGPARTREAAFLFRSIVAIEADSEWLGPTGQLLLGQAMHDAGLDDRMAELYSRSLDKGVCPLVAAEMKLALAGYWYSHGHTADAKAVWTELHGAAGPEAIAAGLRLAGAALDDAQPGLCLELCRSLQDRPGVSRNELLRLAGRAHELAGQPILAAQCYAGRWPLP